MKTRRVKFIWGASHVIRGRWFLGLFGRYDHLIGDRDSGLAISVRGLLLWLGALLLAAYFAGTAAIFGIWQRNPYNLLSYADALLYPLRRAEISEKKGRAFLQQGGDLFRARKYHDAANLLRLGLARVPRDYASRLLLAQYYLLLNQRPSALRILQEGLTAEYPGRPYLELLFNAADQSEDFALTVKLAKRYAPVAAASGLSSDLRWLQSREFAALTAEGNQAQALALAESEPPGDTANEHRVLALLALQRPDDAVALLQQYRASPNADPAVVTRLLVRALREAKRFPEMDAALAGLRALEPTQPHPLVYAVVQNALAGREAAANAALDDYLFRFGGSTANLGLLADPLAEIDDLSRLQRCADAAAERGYPMTRFNVLLVQVHVDRGEWEAAARVLATLPPQSGPAGVAAQLWHEWSQRVIEAALTPTGAAQPALVEFLRSRPWPVRIFRKSTEAMLLARRLDTAREVIDTAQRAFPASAWFRAKSDEVNRLVATRQEASLPAIQAASGLATEKQYFARLDELMGRQEWADAEKWLREGRTQLPPPSWLVRRDADMNLAQLRVSRARGDRMAMISAARMYLNGNDRRATELLDLARGFFREGDKDSAIALAREIQRWSPQHPVARRLLAEWQPPPASPPKK